MALPNFDCEIMALLPLDVMLLVPGAFSIERGFSTEQAACHFPGAESGRAVRALIESLLL